MAPREQAIRLAIISLLFTACVGEVHEDRRHGAVITGKMPPKATKEQTSGTEFQAEVPKVESTPSPKSAAPKCKTEVRISATGNLYLAGMPAGTVIKYEFPSGDVYPDAVETAKPASASFPTSCLYSGAKLQFSVANTTVSEGVKNKLQTADGDAANIAEHLLGGIYGKAQIHAPMNSLLAVFLGAGDLSSAAIPEALDFTTSESRNYVSLQPKAGQIFFVGDGKTAEGSKQTIIVPEGAVTLYLGTMDAYEWHNNIGMVFATIEVF